MHGLTIYNMKEEIKRIMHALNYVFDNVICQDGMKHLIIGVILASALKLFIPIVLVFVVVIAILVAKELVYDKKMAQGTPEPRDLLWGIVGMVFGLL